MVAGSYRPPLKLDAGRLFADLVGESESNLCLIIPTVEAITLCALLLNEQEKGFLGTRSSGAKDGGGGCRPG